MSENITNIKIYPITSTKAKNLKANGSCVVKGAVQVNFTIIEGSKGLFASLPRRSYEKNGETKWVDEVRFPDKELYTEFQATVLAAFADFGKSSQTEASSDDVPF